ncbi:hypothetical protein [Streptomyces sp. NPDC052036]|uniref:hypothetical protein n=1 Tax=Streptomyces sp. NPDC052036 TaxID=3155171 RepID=UPI003443102F
MPGTVLLLAASPAGKGCLVDAASVLPVLAAVAPAVLSGTDTANVVELADPLEPQAVLTRLRAAAAVPGPLTVFLVGQLQLDRREHLPHLALARTTPSTVRYTAFPWHWFREELRLRPPGGTTVFTDLHADAETWRYLRTRPLDCGRSVLLYGRVAPPPPRRALAAPAYMKAVATILRSGHRPDPGTLHHEALTRSLAETGAAAGTERDIVLGPVVNSPAPYGPWHTPPAGYAPHPGHPGPSAHPEHPAPTGTSVPSAHPEQPLFAVQSAHPERPEQPPSAAGSAPPVQSVTPRQTPPPGPPADAPRSAGRPPAPRTSPPAVRLQVVAPPPTAGAPQATVPPQAGGTGAPDAAVPSLPVPVPPDLDPDPHTALAAAVQDGRHAEAEALAARWEQTALREHGAGSEEVLHWMEVRADLAMLAGDPGRSCETWLAVAAARLAAGQPPEDPAVEAAVDRAHHQWGRLRDPARARELGPVLAELRTRVPGRREGALDHVHRRLRRLGAGLQTQP